MCFMKESLKRRKKGWPKIFCVGRQVRKHGQKREAACVPCIPTLVPTCISSSFLPPFSSPAPIVAKKLSFGTTWRRESKEKGEKSGIQETTGAFPRWSESHDSNSLSPWSESHDSNSLSPRISSINGSPNRPVLKRATHPSVEELGDLVEADKGRVLGRHAVLVVLGRELPVRPLPKRVHLMKREKKKKKKRLL